MTVGEDHVPERGRKHDVCACGEDRADQTDTSSITKFAVEGDHYREVPLQLVFSFCAYFTLGTSLEGMKVGVV